MEHHRHPDEQGRQKCEDERLQKRDEQLRKLIATLPATTSAPTPRPSPALTVPAAMMNESNTASRMCPAIILAKSRTASANTLAIRPMISTGTSSGAIQIGPGQKCARYFLPPIRSPLMTIMIIVTIASVAVTQILPVAVPPRCEPNRFATA